MSAEDLVDNAYEDGYESGFKAGYDRAVANLRDRAAYLAWVRDQSPARTVSGTELCALYLEATKGNGS